MKATFLRLSLVTATVSVMLAAQAQTTRFEAQPGGGSQMKIDGTSTIHDWTILGALIVGSIELDSKFLADPTKAEPGKVPAKVDVSIPVRTLKSGHQGMDTVTYQAMDQPHFPKIEYHTSDLTLKQTPKSANGPWTFDSKGELAIRGKTNIVSFPVTITRTGKTLKTSGSVNLKMTDYNVQPPAPKILGVPTIKTGDDIKLSFDWVTAEK